MSITSSLLLLRTVRAKYGPKTLFGSREKLPNGNFGKYLWKSYDEVYEIVTSFAKTLEERDLCPTIKEDDRQVRTLGIFCKTREEWVCTWIACWYIGGCIVPLYDTLGEDSVMWIIQQAELRTVVTTTPYINRIIKLKKDGKPELLKNVIIPEELSEEEVKEIEECGLTLYMYNECIEDGRKSKIELKPDVKPETVATMCYIDILVEQHRSRRQLY